MPQQPDDDALLSTYLAVMPDVVDEANPLLISYLSLRRAVGMIGITLPFVLALGKLLLQGPGLQSSISSYYYTPMRDVFVGSLCAIAVFLWSYKGYDYEDNLTGNIAGLAAVGVAIFPTTPELDPSAREELIGGLHLGSAAVFFLALAYFCLRLFKRTDERFPPTTEKLQRNLVYTVCGYTILACVGLIVIVGLPSADDPVNPLAPVFWLEALAVVAFGVSWLTKGETILKDKRSGARSAQRR